MLPKPQLRRCIRRGLLKVDRLHALARITRPDCLMMFQIGSPGQRAPEHTKHGVELPKAAAEVENRLSLERFRLFFP
jgi:hypothetical protein